LRTVGLPLNQSSLPVVADPLCRVRLAAGMNLGAVGIVRQHLPHLASIEQVDAVRVRCELLAEGAIGLPRLPQSALGIQQETPISH
jgi:hypothetical protein